MSLKDMMARDLAFAIGQLPESFTLRGVSYIGAIDQTSNKGKDAFEGLLDTGSACEITVLKSVLQAAPMLKESITVRGKTFRVASVTEDAGGVAWSITLIGNNG